MLIAPTMKVREVIRTLEMDGWRHIATKGSHMHYKHATKPGRVTVVGKPSDDMPPGLLISVLKQAGLRN